MKQTLTRSVLLIAYWIPFAFLAMFGDMEYDSMWLYIFAVADMAVLCWACVKYNCSEIIVFGNIITAVSSYLCLQLMLDSAQGSQWETYFKPLTPLQMLICIVVVSVLIQAPFYYLLKKNQAHKRMKAQEEAAKPVKKSHRKTHKKRK